MLKKWALFTNVLSINVVSFFEMFTIKATLESENQNQKIASFFMVCKASTKFTRKKLGWFLY
jgi:hypothetical protein